MPNLLPLLISFCLNYDFLPLVRREVRYAQEVNFPFTRAAVGVDVFVFDVEGSLLDTHEPRVGLPIGSQKTQEPRCKIGLEDDGGIDP